MDSGLKGKIFRGDYFHLHNLKKMNKLKTRPILIHQRNVAIGQNILGGAYSWYSGVPLDSEISNHYIARGTF